MKITAIETCVLTVPTSKQMALEFPHHKLVVAEISTDEGIKGLGYSLVFGGFGGESVHAYLETRLKPGHTNGRWPHVDAAPRLPQVQRDSNHANLLGNDVGGA